MGRGTLQGPVVRLRRIGRETSRRRRSHPHREADARRARAGGHLVRRTHSQSVGAGRGIEWIIGWSGVGDRRRMRRLRHRHRNERLDHVAVVDLRSLRSSPDLWSRRENGRNDARLDDGQDRPDHPERRGLRAGVRRHSWAGRIRSRREGHSVQLERVDAVVEAAHRVLRAAAANTPGRNGDSRRDGRQPEGHDRCARIPRRQTEIDSAGARQL